MKAKRATSSRRKRPAARCNVEAFTWQPAGQIHRTVRKSRVTFRDPAQFIKDAAAVMPKFKARGITVIYNKGVKPHGSIWLTYGVDPDGTQWHVDARIQAKQHRRLLIAFLLAHEERLSSVSISGDMPMLNDAENA